MSLVNKMLKDLSERERASPDVMHGITVTEPAPRSGGVLGRLVGLVLIAAVVTAGLWYVYGPKPQPVPQPRASLQAAAAQAPPVAAPAMPAPVVEPPAEPATASQPAEASPAKISGTVLTSDGLTLDKAFEAGRAAAERGDYKSANGHFSNVLLADPTVNPVREALVKLRMDHGRLEDARRVLNRGFEFDADHAPFAALNARLRKLEAAAPPDEPTATRPTSVEDALRAGNPAEVERRLIKLLVANRTLHPAREALVNMRIEQNRVTDARRSLNIGLGVAPEHVPYQNLDERLRDLERPVAKPASPPAIAPASATKAAPIPPADPATAEAQALDLIGSGRANEAASLVSRTREAYPRWPGYARLAARIELARDRPAAALALLEPNAPAYAADPEHHGLMASAYQRLGRHPQASRVYRALLTTQPDEGRWWAGYAISRDALGDRAEAVQAYSEALKRGNLDHRVRSYVTERLDSLRQGG